MKVPVCIPTLSGEEWKYLKECLDTNWISSKGKFIEEFEDGFADYIGVKYGCTTTSGTAAIHLALISSGIKPGDEVIVPAFTMMGSIFPIIYCGAKPVLVDSEVETWNIDVSKIEEKITERTKAIMVVHIYGHPCDMEPIMDIANKYDLYVVEDAAEAHGAEYKGKKVGTFGDLSCFSFYANKIITTGEGGMLLTNNKGIYEKAKRLKDMAFTEERRFLHYDVGFNYRMTNMQAAIGLAQLEKINTYVEARRRNAKLYNELLKDIEGIKLPSEKKWAKNVYWMYSILVDEKKFGMSRDALMNTLADEGIDTRPFFVPMHQQPVLRERGLFGGEESYPIAEELSKNGLNLPSSSSLSKNDIELVSNIINELKRDRI
jgi:perosamine synthetase